MPLPRRPLAFSLRTLLVLVGVVCGLASWVARERRFVMERREALEKWGRSTVFLVKPADGQEYAYGTPRGPLLGVGPPRVFGGRSRATVPWIRRLLGDEAVRQIWIPQSATDVGDAARVSRLFPEATTSDFRYTTDASPLPSPSSTR